jgi:rfaE bifunctional protein nucleotidyltransferase chain/domain
VNSREKIIQLQDLPDWREKVRASGKKLVVTNGCFDLLHVGHVSYLEAARNLGDLLLVGLNSDSSVRSLKGEGRPVNTEVDRAIVLAALECVSAVTIFSDTRAVRFLELARPDIYVKGGDYTIETLDKNEREIVEKYNGKIIILPVVPGKSTTALLNKMMQQAKL